jgi:hypothetical protein
MKGSKKTLIILVAAVSIALLVTVYSASAYSVASLVHEYDDIYFQPGKPETRLGWENARSTFLPWPTTPTGPNISVLELLNQTDTLYYQYIIQSGVLIVLSIISWLAVLWIALRARKLSLNYSKA